MDCNELFLNEVIRVELVPANVCIMSVPDTVPMTEMANCTIGTAAMVIDVNSSDTYAGVLDSAPSLKTTQKPQAAGRLRQHDLTIPTRGDYIKVRQAGEQLAGIDFHVVLHTIGGTRFLLYSLPNSSYVSIEDQFGGEPKQTVKVNLVSMSNMIKLT